MKLFGILLCIMAIGGIVHQILSPAPDTTEHKLQDWALTGVLLAIGIPLSKGKKKPKDMNKK
jgi:hypothetical protein